MLLILGSALAVAILVVVATGVVLWRRAEGAEPPRSAPPTSAPSTSSSPSLGPTKALPDFDGKGSRVVGRIVDPMAGLSYAELGVPWGKPDPAEVDELWGFTGGQLLRAEGNGQDAWYAISISAPMSPTLLGRASYSDPLRKLARGAMASIEECCEPPGHTRTVVADQPLDVGNHDAWLVGMRFGNLDRPGTEIETAVSVIVVVDTGRPMPSVLWVAIPSTHNQLLPDINTVVESLRVEA